MSLEQHHGNVDDDNGAVDRLIAAALDVDPSPALASRIRSRIAIESSRSQSRRWWAVTTLGAVAVLAAAVLGVVANRRQPTISTVQHISATGNTAPQMKTEKPTTLPEAFTERTDNVGARHVVSRFVEKREEPKLVVMPGEAQALLTFLDTLRDGKIDLPEDSTEAMNQTPA